MPAAVSDWIEILLRRGSGAERGFDRGNDPDALTCHQKRERFRSATAPAAPTN
jgi:hypothetical protein